MHSLRSDTVAVGLGILPAPDARARIVDEHVLASIESHAFDRELRLRLDRPSRRVRLEPFLVDRCEVRQIDFERFEKWYRDTGRAPRTSESTSTGDRPVTPFSISTGHRIAGLLHSPATGVDFPAASLYCAAVGGAIAVGGRDRSGGERPGRPALCLGRHLRPGAVAIPRRLAQRGTSLRLAPALGFAAGGARPQRQCDGVERGQPSRRLRTSGSRPRTALRRCVSRARAVYALNAAWLPIQPATRSTIWGFAASTTPLHPGGGPWGDGTGAYVRVEGGEYPIGLPSDVRLARLAVILPDTQLREARALLASAERATRRIVVSRCEVSRREYRSFLDDPLARSGLFANPQEPAGEDYIPDDWTRQSQALDLPVSGMSWWAADAFARWAGGRLPRARGSGSCWRPARRRGSTPGATDTTPRRRPPPMSPSKDRDPARLPGFRDSSAGGVLHLAGNVSEWTQSIAVDRGNYAMWVQGGNWLLPGRETARSSFARLVPLNHRSPDIGIRIVYD